MLDIWLIFVCASARFRSFHTEAETRARPSPFAVIVLVVADFFDCLSSVLFDLLPSILFESLFDFFGSCSRFLDVFHPFAFAVLGLLVMVVRLPGAVSLT